MFFCLSLPTSTIRDCAAPSLPGVLRHVGGDASPPVLFQAHKSETHDDPDEAMSWEPDLGGSEVASTTTSRLEPDREVPAAPVVPASTVLCFRAVHLGASRQHVVREAPASASKLAAGDIVVTSHVAKCISVETMSVENVPQTHSLSGETLLLLSSFPSWLLDQAVRQRCCLWRPGSTSYTLTNHQDPAVQEFVTGLVESKAFPGSESCLTLAPRQGESLGRAANSLCQEGMVTCVEVGSATSSWQLSDKAMPLICDCSVLVQPVPLFEAACEDPLKATKFELLLMLEKDGWIGVKRRPPPFCLGMDKLWHQKAQEPSRFYLIVLVSYMAVCQTAEAGIPHDRNAKFYKTMLQTAGILSEGLQREWECQQKKLWGKKGHWENVFALKIPSNQGL